MATYQIIKQTDMDGIWYKIEKNGFHVNNSYTREYEKAEEMLSKLIDGTLSASPKIETVKTVETDENETN